MEHKRLSAEKAAKMAKLDSLMEMFHRLTKSVRHLDEVSNGLKQTITALGGYSQKIGKDTLDAEAGGENKVALAEERPHDKAAQSPGVHEPTVDQAAALLTPDDGERLAKDASWLTRTWGRLTGRT